MTFLCTVSSKTISEDISTAQLLCPWDFLGKNTGVGCYFLLQENLPYLGIELQCAALQADSLPIEPLVKPLKYN